MTVSTEGWCGSAHVCAPAPVRPPWQKELAAIGPWQLRDFLELGALPSAVPCARYHTRHILWEWRLTELAEAAELVVSELVTNAVAASRQAGAGHAVRLWLLGDATRVLILVGDDSAQIPVQGEPTPDAESGRGLLLVEAIAVRWGWFRDHRVGEKVIWAEIKKPGVPEDQS